MDSKPLEALWKSIGVAPLDAPKDGETAAPAAPAAPKRVEITNWAEAVAATIKGESQTIFAGQGTAFTDTASDLDCSRANAVHVDVLVAGTNPSAVLTLYSVPQGAGAALAVALPGALAAQTITASIGFDVAVGGGWVRFGLSAPSGTTPSYTVIATPFVAGLQSATPGSYVTATHSAYSVTNADTQALAANTQRSYLLIVNDSDTIIYIALGATAAVNTGIRLNANGGSYEMSRHLGNLYTGAIRAICAISGKNLLFTEGV